MPTKKQIEANRRNAQKSTGPKTPEGKAAAAQNAETHGLTASRAGSRVVIANEDRNAYEHFRSDMLEEYNPVGAMEYILTERIIGLAWRLRRSERMQTEVIETLISKTKSTDEIPALTTDMPLGRISVDDFAETRIIERLSIYEHRLERALFKTERQLRRIQLKN